MIRGIGTLVGVGFFGKSQKELNPNLVNQAIVTVTVFKARFLL